MGVTEFMFQVHNPSVFVVLEYILEMIPCLHIRVTSFKMVWRSSAMVPRSYYLTMVSRHFHKLESMWVQKLFCLNDQEYCRCRSSTLSHHFKIKSDRYRIMNICDCKGGVEGGRSSSWGLKFFTSHQVLFLHLSFFFGDEG